ncbi:hypothetical protein OG458_42355 (plasmid) [Streptomyces sp. NBC_01281]|uniref:hypothetical protein n=1 Tax=Streptomyces sp. NBC_01281 TaxID=2903811 RepID=UPI002E15597C|nr:hypothetical protein OG458_41450 [Streptomyces sp. NBC_01281]WSK66600.1 hypothetical protein OG458_42355 [Streptomyces sp. NBC_01281]
MTPTWPLPQLPPASTESGNPMSRIPAPATSGEAIDTAPAGCDQLTAAVQRAIEHHLPGGTLGIDIPSMARDVARQVRRQWASERLHELAAKMAGTPGHSAPDPQEEAPRNHST